MILEKIVTLDELETTWSLDDLNRANAILDMKHDLQEVERKKAQNDRQRTTH